MSSSDFSPIQLTEAAARRILDLRQQNKAPTLRLRLTVSGGGCAGFRYDFSLDEKIHLTDIVFARDGAELATDEVSLSLLKGAKVDFVDGLMGAYFQVNNPNASSGCGCGSSFSIEQKT